MTPSMPASHTSSMPPWRYSEQGVSVAVRVTPRGGRDAVDGCETLANGRRVIKVRVRAIAEGGAANAAVIALLSKALKVPRSDFSVLSGATSRLKQIAIAGEPRRLGDLLAQLIAPAPDQKDAT